MTNVPTTTVMKLWNGLCNSASHAADPGVRGHPEDDQDPGQHSGDRRRIPRPPRDQPEQKQTQHPAGKNPGKRPPGIAPSALVNPAAVELRPER